MELADSAGDAQDRIAELSGHAWTLAAVGAAVEAGLVERLGQPADATALARATGLGQPLVTRLAEGLVAAGLARREGDAFVAAPGLAALSTAGALELVRADLRTGLLQQASFFEDAMEGRLRPGWTHADKRLLQAQGTMSAGSIAFIEGQLLPTLGNLSERLDSGQGAFLDVGTGVGAIAIGFCRHHPRLRAVAIDPHEAAVDLARRNVAAAGLEDRVEVRHAFVQDLAEEDAFDLAWLPGNFLPPDVLPRALRAVHRALRPGGWMLNACLGGGDDSPRAVGARLRAVLWGGDAPAPEHVARESEAAGFRDVRLLPRMASGLVPIVARKPE